MGGGLAASLGTSSAWVASSQAFSPPDLWVLVPGDTPVLESPPEHPAKNLVLLLS